MPRCARFSLKIVTKRPKHVLRVATNDQKRLRFVTISKNALGTWYESHTIFRIGEFVAKVLT